MSATSSASASVSATSSAVSSAAQQPASFKIIGIVLAIISGLFIGSSFVFKKKGLLRAQKKHGTVAGEGHEYLKSPLWWTGMTLMIIGEICNLVAYSFTEAILVTPLGALSVVVCAILSSIFLNEKLTFFGKIGCLLSILGATIVALNGPSEQTTSTIPAFQKLFLSPGFLVFGSLVIVSALGLIFFVAPKYGKTSMLVYISICSLIGGLSVACTSGLGSSILTSIRGDNQFKHWFMYFLLGFVVITLLTEINYLNKALELFNTAMVTPTYYVMFTGCTLVTSVILNQGFKASAVDIVTVVMGFLVICCGITLLQLSKVDENDLASKLDRSSTVLLTATRSRSRQDGGGEEDNDLSAEDPGMDSLRGGFGAIGSIHRAMSARRSMRQREKSFDQEALRRRNTGQGMAQFVPPDIGLVRHQLYDNPMPSDAMDKISLHSGGLRSPSLPSPVDEVSQGRGRSSSAIKFAPIDTTHLYSARSSGPAYASHERQERVGHEHSPARARTNPAGTASSDLSLTMPAFPPSGSSYPETDNEQAGRMTTSPTLTAEISDYYANSNPELSEAISGAKSPLSPGLKSRFVIPTFPRTQSTDGHRVPHPKGPRELDQQESRSLVNRRDDDSDVEDEFDDGPTFEPVTSRFSEDFQ